MLPVYESYIIKKSGRHLITHGHTSSLKLFWGKSSVTTSTSCPCSLRVDYSPNHWKDLLPDLNDNKTVIAVDNDKGKDSNSSFDVDTLLILVNPIVSINNLPSSVLVVRASEELPCVRSTNSKLGSDWCHWRWWLTVQSLKYRLDTLFHPH